MRADNIARALKRFAQGRTSVANSRTHARVTPPPPRLEVEEDYIARMRYKPR